MPTRHSLGRTSEEHAWLESAWSLSSPVLKVLDAQQIAPAFAFVCSFIVFAQYPSAIDACTNIIDGINHIVIYSHASFPTPCLKIVVGACSPASCRFGHRADATPGSSFCCRRSNTEQAGLLTFCAITIFRQNAPTFPISAAHKCRTCASPSRSTRFHHVPSSMCFTP